jgi:hypothetical protein
MFNINAVDQLIAFINSAPKIKSLPKKNAKIAL